jgi:hypothetical protein
MRAHEFILETKLTREKQVAIKGAVTIPGLNMATGSQYLNYRFGLALAGAPEYPTVATGAIQGDPLLSTYTDEEVEMINYAAKQVGAGKIRKLSDNRSTELDNTYTTSPVAKKKKNRYGV